MPTIFIAVQCCQCSTMQVKQKKKSSNKWTCVICNQKQSVLKVFAQSFMAKDVRTVVQSFNMSRQLAEQNQLIDEQTLDSPSPEPDDRSGDIQKKKRTDWTEYIDPEEEGDDAHSSGDVLDKMFVTELPKPLFKKPKLRNYSSLSTNLGTGKGNEKSYRPVFGKRTSSNQICSLEKEPTKSGRIIVDPYQSGCTKQTVDNGNVMNNMLSKERKEPLHYSAAIFAENELVRHQSSKDTGASKWRDYLAEEDIDNNLAAKAQSKYGQKAGACSKWTDYITEEVLMQELFSEKEPTESRGKIMDPYQSDCTKQAFDMVDNCNFMKHRLSKDMDETLHAADSFAEKEPMRRQSSKDTEASRWRDYITKQDTDNNLAAKGPPKIGQKAGASSKWNDYITEKNDDSADLMIQSLKNHLGQRNDVAFCTTLYDQRAEDDIHPDFQ